MKFVFNSKNKGFTLIELLVVIAIIGMLSSVVLASLNAARGKARDARRFNDLVQMRNALEIYFAEKGAYPLVKDSSGAETTLYTGTTPGCQGNSGSAVVAEGLVPNYIGQLPRDPSGLTAGGRCYLYASNGADYSFRIHETVESIPNTQSPPHPLRYPPGTATTLTKSLAVYSPGAVSW